MIKNTTVRLGYYAHYPTILEPAPGPWAGMEIFRDHPVDAWRKILTWLKRMEVDYVVAVLSPKFRDNIFHDWPFHYVCELPKYPEARVFAPEMIARHRRITNQVVDIAEALGIDMYFTHFNFYAPRGFIESHPRILAKYQRTRGRRIGGHDSSNRLNTLYGNICWNEPDYREFMQYCWEEFFQAVPKAKGFMITPGEHNQCECPQCKGTSREKADLDAAAVRMKLDFIGTFVSAMDHLGRDSLVRTWYLHANPSSFPKATAFLPKYHVFDCFDAPIDPYTEQEMTRGRPNHLMFVQNGENAAQVLWFRRQYWQRIGQTLAEKNADGALIMHNIDWGLNGMAHPVAGLNLEAFFHYVRHPQDNADHLWHQRVAEMFGPQCATEVLKALDLLSEFTMNVTRVIFLGNEGYTFGPIQPCDEEFAPDPWGVLARDWTPPDWARGKVGRLRDYWEYLSDKPFHGFADLARNALTEDELCPIAVMQHAAQAALQAIDILSALEAKIEPNARGILDGLISSAHITHEHSMMLVHSIRTALLIRAARSRCNADTAAKLATEALTEHTAALDALKRQIGWINALPHDTLDFRNWLRLRAPEFNSFQAHMFTPLQLMEIEHQNLQQWMLTLAGQADTASVPSSSMPSLTALAPAAMQEQVWLKE